MKIYILHGKIHQLPLRLNNKILAIADSLLQQKELIGQMDDLRSAFKVDEKSLMEKYGKDVSIDLATGDIKENVSEAKAEPVK